MVFLLQTDVALFFTYTPNDLGLLFILLELIIKSSRPNKGWKEALTPPSPCACVA